MATRIDNENHYGMTYRYLQVLGAELRAVLHDHGVKHVELQRKIVEAFLFNLAMTWDDGCLVDREIRAGEWRPTPCFRDTADIASAKTLVVPDGNDAFHEMAALGAADDIFQPDDPIRGWQFEYNGEPARSLLSPWQPEGG